MTRLFTYQPIDNTDKHKVIHTDAEQAREYVESGKAVKLDLPELSKLEEQADSLYEKYERDVNEVKASANPLHTDKVKAYEIDALEQEMRSQSALIDQEYQTWRQTQKEEARKRAATAVVSVSKNDETVADQMVTRYSLRLATASDDDINGIASDLQADIAHLTDGQKVGLQKAITPLLGQFESQYRNTLVDAVQDVRNGDLLSEKVANQLPTDVLTKLRMHDALKDVRI